MSKNNPFFQLQQNNASATIVVTEKQKTTDMPIPLNHYQVALGVDLAKISALKVMEERAELKRKLLSTYLGFVMDYMNQGHNYPNDVAVQVMVWLFDVAEIEQGLKLAFYLMPHQHMPDRFKRRDIETFVCDAMYDWAKIQLDKGETASPWLDDVIAKLDRWALPPPVTSKMLVMSAKHHFREEHFNTVVELLEKAQQINPDGWGAKTLLAQAKQRL